MTTDFKGSELLEELAKPMEDNEVEWRVQTVVNSRNGLRALVVPFVQARAVQARLDKVFGLGWKSQFREIQLGNILAIECTISVLLNGQWISRSDAAELTHIEAIKGGYSDALKRAAVHFGIGRFLYQLPKQWVDVYDNPPQAASYEYFSGDYTVSGKKQFVKGYYLTPSISNILKQLQKPQSKTSPQQRGKQSSLQNPTNEELEDVRKCVNDCLVQLQISPEFLPKLFNMVNVQGYTSIEQASYPELQKLYEMINPVKFFFEIGKNYFRLSEEQLLSLASEQLKQPIEKMSKLFKKLTKEDVTAIFTRIRNQQQQRKIG